VDVSGHTVLGRCVSHDPTSILAHEGHESHVAAVPTSHSQSAIASLTHGQSEDATGRPPPRAGQSQGLFVYPNYQHAPELLDDPELRVGRHRKLLRFPSYMASILSYAKPTALKAELNDKFRAKFPRVNITLSKLRSLKREMIQICRGLNLMTGGSLATGLAGMGSCSNSGSTSNAINSCGGTGSAANASTSTNSYCPDTRCLNMYIVAMAHAFFDGLCLSGAVGKATRKPLAGACLIISAKLNDVRGDALKAAIEKIESEFRVERSELLSSELSALIELNFNVHLPPILVNTHYQRLLFDH